MLRKEVPPHEELLCNVKNKYQFILAVAKRARMLVDGAPSVASVEGKKPAMKALGEILEGHIKVNFKDKEELEK